MARKHDRFEEMLLMSKPIKCEYCGGKMKLVRVGVYECVDCGKEAMDDYGKVRTFLEENGNAPAFVVSEATGVSSDVIQLFLEHGQVEIAENSPYFLSCKGCGCSLRYGKYCPDCYKKISGEIAKGFYNDYLGEKPSRKEGGGSMHFLDKY